MAKKKFRIAVRKFAPFESALKKLWDAFCKEQNVTVPVEMVAFELHDLYYQTVSQKGLKDGSWDIAHLNTDWIFDAVNEKAVLDLKPLIDQNPPQNFPDGWHSSLLKLQNINDGIFGLPFHDGPECMIYRKDLLEDENERKNFKKAYSYELSPPKTWAQFKDVATFFNRPEENLYGCVFANYPDGHNMVFDFCLQLWTRGGKLKNADNQINIHSEIATEALDYYRDIVNDENMSHPGSRNFGSVGAGMAFAKGEAALAINWFGFASMCEVIPESKVKGKVGITELPSKPGHQTASLNVYWLYTIGKGSEYQQLAYDFLRFATQASADKLLTQEGGIGCRKSTWTDADINAEIPFYHKLEQLHENAHTLPQIKNWPQIAELIDQMMLQAVITDVPSTVLLKKTQSQIKKLE
ncbi:MAG TPA: extracellular solute-binding protein [Pelobium sp.]|nr:extracellular solute-binding protein [Pelobium sp.]